ncbi:MAG: wax ester/triacylglycerol synthase family O-acyltransferase [Halioglobus sp.]|nr:wax ester/triacylglycerol synthase family O-acyltransferase [Halioglobus sp.]
MPRLNQLSREDVMFVAGETESIYQHVAGLVILDTSNCPDFNYNYFRRHCEERISLIPHFRWKLHAVPLGLDRPYWVEDEHFSFDHHIRRVALPAPGDRATLCEVAASLYANHLDHSKPLWEMWLIEGLEGGGFAYLQKFHHCMMDGEGALKMIEVMCDFEANPSEQKQVDRSISEARAGHVPSTQQRSTRAWRHLVRLPGDAARGIYNILRPKLLEQFVWPRSPQEGRPEVPTAPFNGEISSARAIAVKSLPIEGLLHIKQHFGVSLNDVVLALVSSALRAYLIDRAELPTHSLRTNIPVSLRTADDDQLSNKVTTTTVTLATNIEDAGKRLQAINAESTAAKAQAHGDGMGVVELFQMMPPILVSTIMDTLPAEQAPQILGANLIVSNVRSSPIPLYIAGARMEKMYPVSILTAGMGINITCVSYLDEMDFGVVVDPDLVQGFESIAESLEQALGEYLALLQPTRRKPKRKPGTRPGKKTESEKKPTKATTGKKKKSAAKNKKSAKHKSKSRAG